MTKSPGPADDRTFTLAEASRLTGLSVDALRQRIKRGKLEGLHGNDGLVRVRLTTADLEAMRPGATSPPDPTLPSQPDDRDQTIGVLRGELTSLREALMRERQRADAGEAQGAAARARADHVERERDEARQEREDARVRAATAEGEVKGLREALAEARRPFWRRWTGL